MYLQYQEVLLQIESKKFVRLIIESFLVRQINHMTIIKPDMSNTRLVFWN